MHQYCNDSLSNENTIEINTSSRISQAYYTMNPVHSCTIFVCGRRGTAEKQCDTRIKGNSFQTCKCTVTLDLYIGYVLKLHCNCHHGFKLEDGNAYNT